MTFNQTNAPTGWTKDTGTDNAAFRLVSGSVSSGGSVNFTTAFANTTASVTVSSVSGSAGATTLSTPQIPSHAHTSGVSVRNGTNFGVGDPSASDCGDAINTGSTGGGGSHTHPFSFSSGSGSAQLTLAVKYVDLIIAQKN